MKSHLLIIDPQNDFCSSQGTLYVQGAAEDSERIAKMINRVGSRLEDIHVTLDTHHRIQVFHPLFWRNSVGEHPSPFTLIQEDDIRQGKWLPVFPTWTERMLSYTHTLAENGRYVLCVWPEHCLIGTWGHNIVEPIAKALAEWESSELALVDFVTKGSNLWTEHYSAVSADVPDPSDSTTQLNTRLIQLLQEADVIGITGQALSHCVANTVRDIANNFGDENIRKLMLIEDTTSNVTGFEKLGQDFVSEMTTRGMQVTTSEKFLA